jgi:hypothetical protein
VRALTLECCARCTGGVDGMGTSGQLRGELRLSYSKQGGISRQRRQRHQRRRPHPRHRHRAMTIHMRPNSSVGSGITLAELPRRGASPFDGLLLAPSRKLSWALSASLHSGTRRVPPLFTLPLLLVTSDTFAVLSIILISTSMQPPLFQPHPLHRRARHQEARRTTKRKSPLTSTLHLRNSRLMKRARRTNATWDVLGCIVPARPRTPVKPCVA